MADSQVMDDAGREQLIPSEIERVVAAGAPAEVLLYTLVPERLVGWNRELSEAARRFIPDHLEPRTLIRTLPEVDDASFDAEFIALDPDLIVDYGSLHPDYAARADAVQARIGVPYLLYDGSLRRIPHVYRTLGRLLGVETRAERLAGLAEALLEKYEGYLADGTLGRRVYVTDSANGLVPVFADQSRAEVFELLGAENVAGRLADAVDLPISFEDILRWQPDAIFALNPAFIEHLESAPEWHALTAVQQGRVYVAPALPFDWLARPPSVNRLLGVVWVARTLSRGRAGDAFLDDLRSIFADLLHVALSDEELQGLVASGQR